VLEHQFETGGKRIRAWNRPNSTETNSLCLKCQVLDRPLLSQLSHGASRAGGPTAWLRNAPSIAEIREAHAFKKRGSVDWMGVEIEPLWPVTERALPSLAFGAERYIITSFPSKEHGSGRRQTLHGPVSET
jgi:hypothetical protein